MRSQPRPEPPGRGSGRGVSSRPHLFPKTRPPVPGHPPGASLARALAWALAGGLTFLPAPGAQAQSEQPGAVTVSGAVTGFGQFQGRLARGGDVQWTSVTASGSVTRQFVPALRAGFWLRYDYEDWRIRSSPAFGSEAPWERLERPGLGLTLSLALSRTLVVGVSPSLEWGYDKGADAAEAFAYGVALSAARVFSPGRVLGAGAGIYRQLYSVKVSPFVVVNWRLTDRLRIANAVPAGPEGGPGVELRYAPNEDWEMAAGGVFRSDRWRLGRHGAFAGGIGETGGIPMLARISRRLAHRSRLDLYAGVWSAGRLRVKDGAGRDVVTEDFEAAPAVAATVSRSF